MTRQIISLKNIVVLLFFFSSSTFSQTVSTIEINGNRIFSNNDYLSWIKIAADSKTFEGIEDSIQTRIINILHREGYFHSSVSTTTEQHDSTKAILRINIIEGNPTLINTIYIEHDIADSVFISLKSNSIKNSTFSSANIEAFFSDILDYYENSGFPFAAIKIESVYFDNDSTGHKNFADLYLTMEKGTKSTIDRIEISGNMKTDDNVITRAIGVYTGGKYNQNKIDEIPNRLNRLRFFEPVEPVSFYFNSKNEGILKIKIKEKETNNFDGILGYVPAENDKEKGYLTGLLNISLRNLFGTGRSAAFRWQQENRYTQEFELRYLEPWLFSMPLNTEGSLFQRKQDSTYVQRTLEGRFEYLASGEISASLIFNTQSTIPSERRVKALTVFNATSFTSGVNLKIDTRDDYYAPTKGILLINTYKYTTKSINGPSEYFTPTIKTKTNFQRLELDFSYFLEIFRDQITSISVHARELKGSDVELSDLYLLGGANTLRGYREKQFQGNRILWSNLEYRYLLTRRSFAFLFLDTGYYLRNENVERNIQETSGYKIGYGFGLNIETGLGVLGVSFAFSKGDSFGEGKIHFGIINEF